MCESPTVNLPAVTFTDPIHDFRAIWHEVTDVTAKAETVDQLSNQMVELISKVFEAHSVSHWIMDENGSAPVLRRAGSTVDTETESTSADSEPIEDPAILDQYREALAPFSIETSTQAWATELTGTNTPPVSRTPRTQDRTAPDSPV